MHEEFNCLYEYEKNDSLFNNSQTQSQKKRFMKKCNSAKRHQYRMDHNYTVLWSNNSVEMRVKYCILALILCVSVFYSFKLNFTIAIGGFVLGVIFFLVFFILKAYISEKNWEYVTKDGKYLLYNVADPSVPCFDIEHNVSRKKENKSLWCFSGIYAMTVLLSLAIPSFIIPSIAELVNKNKNAIDSEMDIEDNNINNDTQIVLTTEITENNEKAALTTVTQTEVTSVETSIVTTVTEIVEKHEFIKSGYVHSIAKSLNIRKEPDVNSEIVESVPVDSCIEIYSSEKTGWYYTKYNSKEGYVNADYIAFNMYEAPRNQIDHLYDELLRRTIRMDSGSLNMRYGPSTNDDVIITIPNNTEVLIYGEKGDWYYAEYVFDGTIYKGYLSKQFLPDPSAQNNIEPQNNVVNEDNHTDEPRVEHIEENTAPTELYAEEVTEDNLNCDYFYNKYSQYYFYVRFSASTDIEDFTIYCKNFEDIEEMYYHGTLEKGKTLVAGISLPGDFMVGIISFVDNKGNRRYYHVNHSARDGSFIFRETDKF